MAAVISASSPTTNATRPRLNALNQDFTDVNEQIRQAAHIIGLPEDWEASQGQNENPSVIHNVVAARADWVLRWILDKLKDQTEAGTQTRAIPKAWTLLDWVVQILPTSRCATHLRDADFLTVLERTLEEGFGKEGAIEPTVPPRESYTRELSESSETVQENPTPSRKRKRGSPGASSPSKKLALESQGPGRLFNAVKTVIRSIIKKSSTQGEDRENVHSELMKMVLRTESYQAARIMKLWLMAVQSLLTNDTRTDAASISGTVDVSLIQEVWDLRNVDADDDSGASAEQFSTECLVPALVLLTTLRTYSLPSLGESIRCLERLFARHLIAPARAAFFSARSTRTDDKSTPKDSEDKLLSSSLAPLGAKLLQAAQIQDASESLPAYFKSLYHAVPELLDLAIRFSPLRTPKGRITERPWIQAVFIALAEGAGCSLQIPKLITPRASTIALETCLNTLALHDITINPDILRDLFWFHAGVKYPINQERAVQWSLVAAFVKLDPGMFLANPKSRPSASGEWPSDLTGFLFDQISTAYLTDLTSVDGEPMDIDSREHGNTQVEDSISHGFLRRETLLEAIIIPIMSTFARNRNLLGFLSKWDEQLCKIAPISRKPSEELGRSIWQDRGLSLALAELFEKSLTQTQISKLLREHAERLEALEGSVNTSSETSRLELYRKAFGSTVIIQAILGSLSSDESVEAVKPQLLSLLSSFTSQVLDNGHSLSLEHDLPWLTLCELLAILWPIDLHGSASQQKLLHPIIERALKDVATSRKSQDERRVDSSTRAAAMMFLLVTSDHLATIPGETDRIRGCLRKTLKSLFKTRLEEKRLGHMVEVFCSEFAPLMEHLEPDARQASLLDLLSKVSTLDRERASQIADTLSQSIATSGIAGLQGAYVAALLTVLTGDGNESYGDIAANSLIHIHPASLSREQREATLDNLLRLLQTPRRNPTILLSVMVRLMQVPNATAKVASDGSALFDIAQKLRDEKAESPSTLQSLQDLGRLTLSHLVPNKDQTQNKRYLDKIEGKIASILKKPRRCFPARLAVIRGMALAQKGLSLVPLQPYTKLLTCCLEEGHISEAFILDAFNEIALELSGTVDDVFKEITSPLRGWVTSKIGLEGLVDANHDLGTILPAETWWRLHTTIARYQLYPNIQWLVEFSSKILGEPIGDEAARWVLESTRLAVAPLAVDEKMALVSVLMQAHERKQAFEYRLLETIISTLQDKQDDNSNVKRQQQGLLPQLCSLLAECEDYAAFTALLACVNRLIRDKMSLVTQHSIESLIAVLNKLTSRNSHALHGGEASAIFDKIVETSRLILILHRGRLGGRFHLFLPLLQSLLFCLFIPNAGRGVSLPSWLKSATSAHPRRLGPANASHFSHLLSMLCSPTQSSVQRIRHGSSAPSRKTLNDPVKAAREYASQYLYPLLSSYSRFQLNGRLEPEVRASLMPGIMDTVGLAGTTKDYLDAMFAGLDRSTRDVWRGVWSEYERRHGRKAVKGA